MESEHKEEDKQVDTEARTTLLQEKNKKLKQRVKDLRLIIMKFEVSDECSKKIIKDLEKMNENSNEIIKLLEDKVKKLKRKIHKTNEYKYNDEK